MNRQERDNYDYDRDYSGNAGYSPDDEHYHSARNLTNEFEEHYRRERGYQDDDRDQNRFGRNPNQGRTGSAYDQYRREDSIYRRNTSGRQQFERDRSSGYSGNYSRDRFSNYQDDDFRNQQMARRHPDDSRERNQNQGSGRQQGYGTARSGNTSDRYNSLNDEYSSRSRSQQERGSGLGDGYQGSRYGGNSAYLSNPRGSSYEDRNYGRSARNYSDDYSSEQRGRYESNRGGSTEHSSPDTYRRFVE